MVGVPKSKGCGNCRWRKKGCDQQRPKCGQCIRSRLVCDGYEKDLVFVHLDQRRYAQDTVNARTTPVNTQPHRRDAHVAAKNLGNAGPVQKDQAIDAIPATQNPLVKAQSYDRLSLIDALSRGTAHGRGTSRPQPAGPIQGFRIPPKSPDFTALPFSSLHLVSRRIRDQSLGLFQFFSSVAPGECTMLGPNVQTQDPNDSGLPGGEDFDSRVMLLDPSELRRESTSNELRLAALLASVACRVEQFEGLKVTGSSAYFVQTALTLFRKELNGHKGIEENHIHAIYYLCAAEIYRGNIPSAMTHLRAARKLLDDFGGLDSKIDGRIWMIFIRLDAFLTQILRIPPVFDYPSGTDSAAGSLDERFWKWAPRSPLKRLGKELYLYPATILPPALRQVIYETIETIVVTENCCALDKVPWKVVHWLRFRIEVIRHRLTRSRCDDPRADALKQTIILWSILYQAGRSGSGAHKLMEAALKGALIKSQEGQGWGPFPRLYMWILSVGAMACLGDDENWFLEQLVAWISRQVYVDVSEAGLRTFSEGFLFYGRTQDECLRHLSKELTRVFRKPT